MNCNDFRDMISPYIDDMVSEDERILLEKHIMQCDECNNELEQMRLIVKQCGQLEEMPLPNGFKEQLHAKLVKNDEGLGVSTKESTEESNEQIDDGIKVVSRQNKADKIRKHNRRIRGFIGVAASLLVLFSVFKFMSIFTQTKMFRDDIENYALSANKAERSVLSGSKQDEMEMQETARDNGEAKEFGASSFLMAEDKAEDNVDDKKSLNEKGQTHIGSESDTPIPKDNSTRVAVTGGSPTDAQATETTSEDIKLTFTSRMQDSEGTLDSNPKYTSYGLIYNTVQISNEDEFADIKDDINELIRKYRAELIPAEDYIKGSPELSELINSTIVIKLDLIDEVLNDFLQELEDKLSVIQVQINILEDENIVIIVCDLVD